MFRAGKPLSTNGFDLLKSMPVFGDLVVSLATLILSSQPLVF